MLVAWGKVHAGMVDVKKLLFSAKVESRSCKQGRVGASTASSAG